MKKVVLSIVLMFCLASIAFADTYEVLPNRFNATGQFTIENDKFRMEVEAPNNAAVCFIGTTFTEKGVTKATSKIHPNVVIFIDRLEDGRAWLTPVYTGSAASITCGKKPVKFDRLVFKKVMSN